MMVFQPFKYLKIKHEAKSWWDFGYPLILALSFLVIQEMFCLDLQLVGQDGVLRQVNGLLGVLSGFYIASLTAISAIQSSALDEKMAGDPPTLPVKRRGKIYKRPLKRGEFLRYLFGYLSVASILLFFAGIVIDVLYAPIIHSFPNIAAHLWWLSALTLFVYVFCLSNVIINTLVGVYYLSDRMHRASEREGVEQVDGEDELAEEAE